MARSTNIYILEYEGGELIAAFTVKWEALMYWGRKLDKNQYVKLYRVPDGHKADPIYLDLDKEYRKQFE